MDNLPKGDELSGVIGKLMNDEKFSEILEAVKSSFSASDENDTQKSDIAAPVPQIPALSPELMSKLPEIMSMLSGGESSGKTDSRLADRKRLLQALKPFLSQSRREAVDSIVNIAGIADLLGL